MRTNLNITDRTDRKIVATAKLYLKYILLNRKEPLTTRLLVCACIKVIDFKLYEFVIWYDVNYKKIVEIAFLNRESIILK